MNGLSQLHHTSWSETTGRCPGSQPRICGVRNMADTMKTQYGLYKSASLKLTCLLRTQSSTYFPNSTCTIMASAKAFDFAGETAIVTGAGSRMPGTFDSV
jgi:hypothetical protein